MVKIFYFLLFFSLISCTQSGSNQPMMGSDVRLFEDSPVWKIAKSISKGDTSELRSFFTLNPELLEYKEKRYGKTLLNWSVYAFHYEASKLLCELGADPNTPQIDGRTAFIFACSNYDNPNYLKLLLAHGGNVNYVVTTGKNSIDATPLIAAASCCFENTKILVNAGADVNFILQIGIWHRSALSSAFNSGKIEIVHYLILEAGADFRLPLDRRLDGDSIFICEELRRFPFELDSKDYILKMEVVDFLLKNGIDYWSEPIPDRYFELYDEEFLRKY